MNYLFLNTNLALKLQGYCLKDDVVMFTAHLSVTIKHLTRYKQKVVLDAMLEGKLEYALQHGSKLTIIPRARIDSESIAWTIDSEAMRARRIIVLVKSN